jgi:twitching motility protein PilT
MALFGGRKSPLQRAVENDWKSEEERQELIRQLKELTLKPADSIALTFAQDAGVRQLGAEALLNRPDANTIRDLVEQAQSQPPHVRGFVKRLWSRIPDDVMTKVIDGMLADKTPAKNKLGWELALDQQGAIGVRYLERAVRDAPVILQFTAFQRLIQAKPANQMVDLLLDLSRHSDPRIAATALEALSDVADPRIADLMLERFAAGDAASRELALKWLKAQAERDPLATRARMMKLLSEGEDATRRMCVELLFATGPADEVLLEILNFAKDLVGWLRGRIMETLQTFGDQVLKPAVALLGHPDEQVKTNALVLAENFNDPRLVGPICRMLKDDDWWLRITAADSLGRLKDERAVPYLVAALDDHDTRWGAIDALAQIGSPTALKPLTQLMSDKRQEVRMEVVRAFGRFADPRLLPFLQQIQSKDPSTEVRTRAQEVHRDLAEKLSIAHTTSELGTSAVGADSLKRPLDRFLAAAREQGCSDIHISVGEPPLVRLGGELQRWGDKPALSEAETEAMVMEILDNRQKAMLAKDGGVDLCHNIPEVGRYRGNVYRQRKGMCAAFRVIPNLPPTFSDLRLPGRLTELLDFHQGIIVVSGPAGSGKSTTMAAVINLINETKADHVITLEDPIEFVHPIKTALLNQREVGKHTESFARALRGALREDPDVIMVGEMRDVETIRMSLTAAETGHLVIATMHTTSAIQTVERLVKAFPPDEQQQVRMGLSESLKYVVCQSLVQRKDGKGRTAVFEVLKGTSSVGNLIRDNKSYQLPSMMQIGRKVGMQSVDMALMDMVEGGLITAEVAWARAENSTQFEPLCDPQFVADLHRGAAAPESKGDA